VPENRNDPTTRFPVKHADLERAFAD